MSEIEKVANHFGRSLTGDEVCSDLFPLADLLNINELGHMLRPRLRNNRAIRLSGVKETSSSVS